jgi:hypothetical protein
METHRNYVVDLTQCSCTCSIWQSSSYPCGHAISIILDQKQDPQRYVESIFTIAAYKKTYEQPIIPLDLRNVNGDAMHATPQRCSVQGCQPLGLGLLYHERLGT